MTDITPSQSDPTMLDGGHQVPGTGMWFATLETGRDAVIDHRERAAAMRTKADLLERRAARAESYINAVQDGRDQLATWESEGGQLAD